MCRRVILQQHFQSWVSMIFVLSRVCTDFVWLRAFQWHMPTWEHNILWGQRIMFFVFMHPRVSCASPLLWSESAQQHARMRMALYGQSANWEAHVKFNKTHNDSPPIADSSQRWTYLNHFKVHIRKGWWCLRSLHLWPDVCRHQI